MSANWWSEIAYATSWSMSQFAMQSFWWIWICALSAVVYFLKDWLEETYDRMERLRLRLDIMEKAMGEVEGDIVTICRNMSRDIEDHDGNEMKLKMNMSRHFESAMKTHPGVANSQSRAKWELFWTMICSEVSLQSCTQIMDSRALLVLMKKPVEPKTMEKEAKILQNLNIRWARFWTPFGLGWHDMQAMNFENVMFYSLQSRLLELRDKVVQHALNMQNEEEYDQLLAGMPLLVETILEMHVAPHGFNRNAAESYRKRSRSAS